MSNPIILNPIPMEFELISFGIVLKFEDDDDILTFGISQETINSVDIFRMLFKDQSNFAEFSGQANDEEEANEVEFSKEGSCDGNEVDFALDCVDRVFDEEEGLEGGDQSPPETLEEVMSPLSEMMTHFSDLLQHYLQ